jgi:hypothetical protein
MSNLNDQHPDSSMLAPIERMVRFMETLDHSWLAEVFTTEDVILLDSFAPFVFQGRNGVGIWAHNFAKHVGGLIGLRHEFGEAQEFSRSGDTVFFSQPIIWKGANNEVPFTETGGLAVVLTKQGADWRIRNFAWAVTAYAETRLKIRS